MLLLLSVITFGLVGCESKETNNEKTEDDTNYLIEDKSISEWYEVAKGDKVVILTLGQTTCGHFKNFKPVVEKIVNKYDIDWYWVDVDQASSIPLTQEDVDILNDLFPDFEGTPYTAFVKSGEVIDKMNGAAQYNDTLSVVRGAFGGALSKR